MVTCYSNAFTPFDDLKMPCRSNGTLETVFEMDDESDDFGELVHHSASTDEQTLPYKDEDDDNASFGIDELVLEQQQQQESLSSLDDSLHQGDMMHIHMNVHVQDVSAVLGKDDDVNGNEIILAGAASSPTLDPGRSYYNQERDTTFSFRHDVSSNEPNEPTIESTLDQQEETQSTSRGRTCTSQHYEQEASSAIEMINKTTTTDDRRLPLRSHSDPTAISSNATNHIFTYASTQHTHQNGSGMVYSPT